MRARIMRLGMTYTLAAERLNCAASDIRIGDDGSFSTSGAAIDLQSRHVDRQIGANPRGRIDHRRVIQPVHRHADVDAQVGVVPLQVPQAADGGDDAIEQAEMFANIFEWAEQRWARLSPTK